MISVLIVDDDKKRAQSIITTLINSTHLPEENIDTVHCSSHARKHLRENYYDVLILDVVLPRRLDDSGSHENGLTLLRELVTRKTLKRPEKIIGITADIEGYGNYKKQFESVLQVLIEAKYSNKEWKKSLAESIKYVIESNADRTTQKPTIVLTVHGIRTYGKWQERFQSLLKNEYEHIDFQSFKYGWVSIIGFIVPLFRRGAVSRFKDAIQNLVNDNPGKTIKIFSHSFGTYIVAEGLKSILEKEDSLNLDLIVFSGSVLPSTYKMTEIMRKTDAVVVNDCGDSDYVLWLSQAFAPMCGMAGKVGFFGLNNNRLINRFHSGGHSLYFDDNNNFINKYWKPLFENKNIDVALKDSREPLWIVDGFFQPIIKYFGYVMNFLYLTLVFVGLPIFVYRIFT